MPTPESFVSPLVGCFSSPAGDNPTVAIMEASFRASGYPGRYINCEVPVGALGDAVRGAVAQGWLGFNCSLPHKVAVLDHLDEVAPSAALIGAVNTVRIEPGRLVGENTDGKGFVEALREVTDPAGLRVVLLGGGGAARAIGVETALAGAADVTVVNRDRGRGADLAALLDGSTPATARYVPWDGPYRVPEGTDVLINATSVGLPPAADALVDVDLDTLRPPTIVVDVIPNPPRTRLLREAQARGLTTVDGRRMLVNQAAVNIRLWTGLAGDKAVMHATLDALFS